METSVYKQDQTLEAVPRWNVPSSTFLSSATLPQSAKRNRLERSDEKKQVRECGDSPRSIYFKECWEQVRVDKIVTCPTSFSLSYHYDNIGRC